MHRGERELDSSVTWARARCSTLIIVMAVLVDRGELLQWSLDSSGLTVSALLVLF